MKERYHVFWELVVIFGSVFMFWSLWHLLDENMLFKQPNFLVTALIAGTVISAIGLYVLNRHVELKKK